MIKKYALIIRGKEKEWTFITHADSKYVNDWLEDDLQIEEVVNSIPIWAHDLGLTRIWFFIQDIFNFRNPFK
jgi:hypothetical protein